jgi:ABC-type multidrug transport system fused ATPase/permease subunit
MLATLRKCLHLLPPSSRRNYLLLLPLSLLTGLAEMGAAAGIFAIITVLTNPARGLAVGWIAAIARHLPWQSQSAIVLQLTGLLAVFYVARSALLLAAQYFRIRVAHAANTELSSEMLRRYLSASYPFHFGRNSTDLIRICSTTVGQSLGVLSSAMGLLADTLMSLGMISVVIATSPGLALASSVALVVIVLVVLRLTRQAAARIGQGSHDVGVSSARSLQHALGGVKELKVLGRERFFSDEYAAHQREAMRIGYLSITLDSVPAVVLQTVLVCGALGLVAALTVAGQAGFQTLPITAIFGYAGLRILPMANGLIGTMNHIRRSGPAVDELYNDFIALGAADKRTDGAHVEFKASIKLDAVTYTYPSATNPAIAHISLVIRRGESIGIIGPTGAGKSTLVDVILGLLPPTSGRITVDGVDLATTTTPWKRRVGYVPQTIYLIDDSLRRNIALGIKDHDIDDRKLHAAVTAAQLRSFVSQLPEGLATPVGDRGVRLSGGERQRIAIARALYHDPDVLIFDEATASLDVRTEAEINRTIDALRSVKTVVVIAHRLSTVKSCDRLVWLEKGRVVDVGSFDELRQRSADFRALVAMATV